MNEKYELKKQADEILRRAGYDASGRPRGTIPRAQYEFEFRMQRGAYSSNGARRKWEPTDFQKKMQKCNK